MVYPKVARVRQRFDRPLVNDIDSTTQAEVGRMIGQSRMQSGDTVAVAAGSRGIVNIGAIVHNTVIALQQARARYQTAIKERVLQEQTLAAEQKKYELGASTVFLIIQYQRDLAQAQSNEVTALAAYAKARTDLDRVTGQTLRAHNIDVVEAMAGRVSRPPDPIPQQ